MKRLLTLALLLAAVQVRGATFANPFTTNSSPSISGMSSSNNVFYGPTNYFLKDYTGAPSTNRMPFWVDKTAAGGAFQFQMYDPKSGNNVMTLREDGAPNVVLYLGGGGGTAQQFYDAVSLQANSSANGNTDPRITLTFEVLGAGPPETQWRFRETNLSLVVRDPNSFDQVDFFAIGHDGISQMPTKMYFGSNMLDTVINGSNSITFTAPLYSSGQNTAMFTRVNTNFVQGFIYSNFYGAPIDVRVDVRMTYAAVAGDANMDIQQPAGTFATRVGSQTTASTVAVTNNAMMSWIVPVNGTYAITNTLTTGAGNAVSVNSGQIFVY